MGEIENNVPGPEPRDEPLITDTPVPDQKPEMVNRVLAAIVDMVLVVIVSLIPFVGGIVGTIYFLIRDGLDLEFMDRRSLGKKLFKLRPIRLDGRPMDIGTSVRRNLFLAIAPLFGIVPLLGWLIAPFVGFIVLLLELLTMLFDDEGRRLGDRFAETRVVDAP